MKCKQIQERLIDFTFGELSTKEMDEINSHIKDCATCKSEYQNLKATSATVQSIFSNNNSAVSLPKNMDKKIHSMITSTKKQNKEKISFKRSGIAVAVICAILLISLNISSVFAYKLNKIPIVSDFVKFVVLDKGLLNAVKGQIGQKIEQSSESNGITFTVHEVIASHNRISILYSIKLPENIESKALLPIFCLVDKKGNPKHGMGGSAVYVSDNHEYMGSQFYNPINGDFSKVNMSFQRISFEDGSTLVGNWSNSFYIDVNKAKERLLKQSLNYAIQGKNGKIILNEISTTGSETVLKYKTTGTVKGLYGVSLIDQNGLEYTQSGGRESDTEGHLMFSMTYPNKPVEIKVQGIREVENVNINVPISIREQSPIKINFNNNQLELRNFEIGQNNISIRVLANTPPFDKVLSATLKDSNGTIYSWNENFRIITDFIKIIQGDNANIFQKIEFNNANPTSKTYDLTIKEAIVYNNTNSTINLSNSIY